MVKDETRIVGNLPNLRMEIVHRQDPDGAAEHVSIHLSATPSFQAAETLLSPAMWGNPLALWTCMTQAWLTPWTQALGGGGNPWLDALTQRDSK
ncbi:conserved protein of unknown function [Magnetospirillum sp. XM-1]|uniref:hypothetical protein n=1 Tax=Magnetospirillum sp. XM-1 TaxID=1663591 RepID=UPI00073DEB3C|nr:hypothetical protein [Magnetospirillum sp. XM-1]CUW40939.1 conserved protein of unknown function [Magnetospirillum sp. XM-1]